MTLSVCGDEYAWRVTRSEIAALTIFTASLVMPPVHGLNSGR